MKKILLTMAGLLLMLALFWLADIQKVAADLKSINPLIIIGACILQIATIYLISLQWYLLAKRIDEKASYKSIFYINMVGSFVEALTPAVKAGGEAAKVLLLKNNMGFSYTKAITLVGMQKVISIFPFLVLCLCGTVWFLNTLKGSHLDGNIFIWSIIFLLLIIVISLLVLLLFAKYSKSMVAKFPFLAAKISRINNGIYEMKNHLRNILQKKEQLFLHFSLSFGIWIFFAVKAYLLACFIGMPVNFLQIGIITYLTYMVAMVPLLPGGLGTFETSMVLLLAAIDIPFYQGMTFTLVFRFSTFWFVFIWSVIYYIYHNIIKFANKKEIVN